MFREYMHVERYNNDEVQGIEIGELYIFPKLDGTNSSLWWEVEGDHFELAGGSRTRTLALDRDNAGFLAYAKQHQPFFNFFKLNPNLRLYGEWLVPHTLKTYREDVWKKFHIFDVYNDISQGYLTYETYKPLLDRCSLDYIPPLRILKNGVYDDFIKCLSENVLYIQDGKGIGEGIVIKNYQFYNKFGNQVWAKIINTEFKEMHHKEMGAPESERVMCEETIALQYCTKTLCDKTYAKIHTEKAGWTSKYIPELLGRVFHDIVTEETWNILKDKKNNVINFSLLRHFVYRQVKLELPELF